MFSFYAKRMTLPEEVKTLSVEDLSNLSVRLKDDAQTAFSKDKLIESAAHASPIFSLIGVVVIYFKTDSNFKRLFKFCETANELDLDKKEINEKDLLETFSKMLIHTFSNEIEENVEEAKIALNLEKVKKFKESEESFFKNFIDCTKRSIKFLMIKNGLKVILDEEISWSIDPTKINFAEKYSEIENFLKKYEKIFENLDKYIFDLIDKNEIFLILNDMLEKPFGFQFLSDLLFKLISNTKINEFINELINNLNKEAKEIILNVENQNLGELFIKNFIDDFSSFFYYFDMEMDSKIKNQCQDSIYNKFSRFIKRGISSMNIIHQKKVDAVEEYKNLIMEKIKKVEDVITKEKCNEFLEKIKNNEGKITLDNTIHETVQLKAICGDEESINLLIESIKNGEMNNNILKNKVNFRYLMLLLKKYLEDEEDEKEKNIWNLLLDKFIKILPEFKNGEIIVKMDEFLPLFNFIYTKSKNILNNNNDFLFFSEMVLQNCEIAKCEPQIIQDTIIKMMNKFIKISITNDRIILIAKEIEEKLLAEPLFFSTIGNNIYFIYFLMNNNNSEICFNFFDVKLRDQNFLNFLLFLIKLYLREKKISLYNTNKYFLDYFLNFYFLAEYFIKIIYWIECNFNISKINNYVLDFLGTKEIIQFTKTKLLQNNHSKILKKNMIKFKSKLLFCILLLLSIFTILLTVIALDIISLFTGNKFILITLGFFSILIEFCIFNKCVFEVWPEKSINIQKLQSNIKQGSVNIKESLLSYVKASKNMVKKINISNIMYPFKMTKKFLINKFYTSQNTSIKENRDLLDQLSQEESNPL